MKISIKMHTVLKGSKGCLSYDEIKQKLYSDSIINEIRLNVDEQYLDKFIEKVAREFADRVPRQYDYDFNRIVAGLMGSTCYMPENFERLNAKPIENILNIATKVEDNGHHSTFGHSFLTLEIEGLPKALAMVLNNEKEYNTSEKSARFTKMNNIEPTQLALYNKWLNIFEREIQKLYPNGSSPFFDEKGIKARKLAQENARYLISVFTPTNMEYSTSFRQINYICHWMEKQILKPENNFYATLKNDMQEFVDFFKEKNLYSEKLGDGKDRNFSLFGEPMMKKIYSNNYQGIYKMSFAALAQSQRHRTLDFSINKFSFVDDFSKINDFYIPPIIAKNKELKEEYLRDLSSVASCLPQGTMLEVNEAGSYDNFILKVKERLCSGAQKEIRDLTLLQTKEYSKALFEDSLTLENETLKTLAREKAKSLEKMSRGARCTNGFKCNTPCGFKDGINLESEV